MPLPRLLPALACLLLLPGCFLFRPHIPKREPQGTLSVVVSSHGEHRHPIYLTIYYWDKGERGDRIITRVVEDGAVTGFVLPLSHEYEVRALMDQDGDGRRSGNEAVDSVRGVRPDPDLTAAHRPIVLDLPLKGSPPKKTGGRTAAPDNTEHLRREIEKFQQANPGLPIPPLPGSGR